MRAARYVGSALMLCGFAVTGCEPIGQDWKTGVPDAALAADARPSADAGLGDAQAPTDAGRADGSPIDASADAADGRPVPGADAGASDARVDAASPADAAASDARPVDARLVDARLVDAEAADAEADVGRADATPCEGLQHEICNGLDDDCDGAADESLQGCDGCVAGTVMPCGDTGVCRNGRRRCVEGAFGACEWELGPAPEACNGLDDDCNGQVDDALATPTCREAVGVCEAAPQGCRGADGWQCDDAAFAAHDDRYEPAETRCDGVDNDCDGAIDEARPPACPEQRGVCAGSERRCRGGAGLAECDAAIYRAHDDRYEDDESRCDGADNDCDGASDEDLTPPPAERDVGVCAGLEQVCRGRAGWQEPDYRAIEDYQAVETACDGLDNDCDGATDPMLRDPARVAACRPRGACGQARLVCDAAAEGGTRCDQIGSGPEVCNGADDDCDGRTDEGIAARPCPEQRGVCAGSTQTCRGAAGFGACDEARLRATVPDYEPREVSCDGLDNDCDGRTDSGPGLVAPDCDRELGVCAGATARCAGRDGWACDDEAYFAADDRYEAEERSCDRVDNDCDGAVDEGNDCFCSERARTWCRSLGREWDVAQEPANGKLICTRGLDFGRNCSPCDSYRIVVWRNNAPDGTCDNQVPRFSTVAGQTYGGHDPCACGDTLRACGPWEMLGCIPD